MRAAFVTVRTLTGAAALLSAACSTMPGARPEAPPLPDAWRDAPVGANASLDDWWHGFNDPVLDQLVAEALGDGPSVKLAASRVEEARALSRSTIARYLPELNVVGQGNYARTIDGPGRGPASEQATGSYGAEVSWEIPLFARIEAASVAARANTRSAIADLRGARVALAADVAQAYVDLRAARESYAALSDSVAVADQLAGILETGARAGFTSESDAADARRLAESARARLPVLVIEARRAENVLAVLRGIAPGTESEALLASLESDAPVPSLPLTEAPAAPADLLRLRPDVAAAEAQALVAAAGVADARADLLPQLNLIGAVTVSDNLIGTTLPGAVTQSTATPLITIPLFDWGSRFAQVRASHARFDQALIAYRQTVTQAVAEASNALTALDQGRLRLAAARAAETAAETTARGGRLAYEAGIKSLADRLLTEQQLIDARLARIDAEAAEAGAAIATYRAFGGGPALKSGGGA
jgi:outer membrane protein, multidrug efflux system